MKTCACPHCMRETDASQQRCNACGLTMMSDAHYQQLQRLWQLHTEYSQPASPDRKVHAALTNSLATQLQTVLESLPWLHPTLNPLLTEVSVHQNGYDRLRQLLRMNILIGVFFVLVALGAGAYTQDGSLMALLMLPAIGWYWLGIRQVKKQLP